MEKRAKQAVIGTLLVLVLILVLGAVTLVKYLSPGKEKMSLADYYHVPAGEAMIILDDKIYENFMWTLIRWCSALTNASIGIMRSRC